MKQLETNTTNATERNTNLRQATAKAYATGLLSEMVLEEKTEDGKKLIEGYLTIKTSEFNFVRFKASAYEKTKDGRDNAIYKGLQTCKNEYKTIAEVGEEEATEVSVSGEINAYTGVNGDVIGFKSNFFNRPKKPLEATDFKSEFEIEIYLRSIVPEIDKNGMETGRVIVNGWLPTYSGIEPVALVAGDDIADGIKSCYEVGQTVLFRGDIINNRIEHVKEIPMKIGKPKIERSYTYKNDMLITGASEPYGEEGVGDIPAAYKVDTIKLAIAERESKLAERKARAISGGANTAKPSAEKRGRTLNW